MEPMPFFYISLYFAGRTCGAANKGPTADEVSAEDRG